MSATTAKKTEVRRFEARDSSGKLYWIIASRGTIMFGIFPRHDPWKFMLEDGRELSSLAFGHYTIVEDSTELTTTDPNEPQPHEC